MVIASDASAGGIVLAVVLIGVYLFLVTLFARYAEAKGYSFLVFWLLGAWLSPLVSGLLALVAPDRLRPQASDAPGPDLGQLSALADLHERGALTDAEFAAQKARLLG